MAKMSAKMSRRETLGIGLGAGLSATLAGTEAAQAAPSDVAFTLLLVNDIYTMGAEQGRNVQNRTVTSQAL